MPSKKSLKIFVDAYLLNKEPQGTQTYIRELYIEVAKQNPNHIFYLGIFKDSTVINTFSKYKNIKFVFYRRKLRILRMLFEIPKLIKKEKFDFAHFQYVIPLSRYNECEYIVTIHDILFIDFPEYFSNLYRLKRNALFKYSARKANYLLTVSNYSKEAIEEKYKLKNKNIYVISNGVSEDLFESYNKQKAIDYLHKNYNIKNYILYVSRIEPRKNQELLVKMFLDLNLDKQFELVFIGKSSIKNKNLNAYLQKLPTVRRKKIYHFESIDQNGLMNFYKGAKLFVFPSLCEGFGLPPIEAGALKIPVLCANTTAMSDYDFFEPYFKDPNNVKEFSISFTNILKDQDEKRIEKIQKTIRDKYSWKESATKLSAIINSI